MARRAFMDGSNMPKSGVCREIESWEVPMVAKAIFDEAVESDDVYPTDRTWLVTDGEGSVVGEVQAWSSVLACLYALLRFPPRPDERRTVILKTDFQAERN